MTLQQMLYVQKVAESGSIKSAAKQLYMSQSSISQAIMDLERELCVLIFQRSVKGLTLTSEGVEFLRDIRPMLENYSFVREKYKAKGHQLARLSVSASYHVIGLYSFLDAVREVPEGQCLRLSYMLCSSSEIVDNIQSGRSEIGVLFFNTTNQRQVKAYLAAAELEFNPLYRNPLYIYLRKEHPLAEKEMLQTADLLPYPLISYDSSLQSPGLFAGYWSNYFASSLICVSDKYTACVLARSGDGFMMGSGGDRQEMQQQGIVVRPISDAGDAVCGWLRRAKAMLSPLAASFVQHLEDSAARMKSGDQ